MAPMDSNHLHKPDVAAPIALTMGDPAGIGLELTAMAWLGRQAHRIPPFALYGCARALATRAEALGLALPLRVVSEPSDAIGLFDTVLPVIDIPLAASARPGVADAINGAAVITAIERAVDDTVAGRACAVVTNPIAKSVLYQAGFTHPGHTEFLAELARRFVLGGPYLPVMMIASEALRVVPLTIHIPLALVPSSISSEAIIACARIMSDALRRDFAIANPRIAVAGLNPHAGEERSMGHEDADIIAPAIAQLQAEGIAVTGPHPADTLFHATRRATYDAVLAMYHDQALIPAKTLAFDTGVNVTLGLPFVRTSPDHGTAFDIAGRGTAEPSSLIAAMLLAKRMSDARKTAAMSVQ